MHAIDTIYTVALRGYPELPPPVRAAAELRFAATLEHQFSGPDDVANTLRAVDALEETEAEDASAHDLQALQHWVRAATLARAAGFRGLPPAPGAGFEVRLG